MDAGAVILTGQALERPNSRAVAELFAREGGRFVCVSAGHNLEALLAAHGSGSVALSRTKGTILNINLGGGTTKLALCQGGGVTATLAILAGARVDAAPSELAERIVAAANGRPDPAHVLAGALPAGLSPDEIVFSGGVAELFEPDAPTDLPDAGPELARRLRARFGELPAPVGPAVERIRATVIGASQFTVQLSGSTVQVSDPSPLPLRNLPVVFVRVGRGAQDVGAQIQRAATRLDLDNVDTAVAIALDWEDEPSHRRLRALAEGVAAAHRASPRRVAPVVVALRTDVGASLGAILAKELGIATGIVAIDGLDLAELDHIDIGERIMPANVVPVVVKSLVFPG